MHGDATLTPVAMWAGWLLRFGVPFVCAAIASDALRRPAAAFPGAMRRVWIAVPLGTLIGLLAGFIWPSVVALRYLAVLAVPFTVVLGIVYLLSVVFARVPDQRGFDGVVRELD